MPVNVLIKKTKDISVEEILKFNKLSYGVMDENFILEFNKIGNTTIFYCPSCIGRGFDVSFDEKKILLRLPLPSTPTDIAIFYDVVIKIANYMKVKDVIREDKKVLVSKIADFIEFDQNLSIDSLTNFYSQIISGEMENFTIFCALNPIVLGKDEFEFINGSLDNFERLLSSLQEKDVYYAGPTIYKRRIDDSLFGLYFINEDVLTVIPIEPGIFNQDCVISNYYCFIRGDNAIPYKDFISNVTKIGDYDCGHIIVSIDEKKINSLAKKYGVDFNTYEKKYNRYFSIKEIDNGFFHNSKITNMELTCDKLAGFNHLVVFLKWAYLNNLLREEILEKVPKLKDSFNESLENIRNVLKEDEYLEGKIRVGYFVEKAHNFVREFYKFNTKGYPECVDMYAENYLGTEEYNSEKYKNEAYLFVPFDDYYYLGLSKYIDDAWNKYNESCITSSNFVYDEKKHCFSAIINSINFECEELSEGYEEKAISLSKAYKEKLFNIIESMKEEIVNFYGKISNEKLIESLGIPTINLDNDLLTYTEHTLDDIHIIDLEFSGMFDKILEVRIDG